jgi:hypothetical protein
VEYVPGFAKRRTSEDMDDALLDLADLELLIESLAFLFSSFSSSSRRLLRDLLASEDIESNAIDLADLGLLIDSLAFLFTSCSSSAL